MCFFAIIGVVPKERVVGHETSYCPLCGRETIHEIVEVRHWFTLFLVPLFPVSGTQTYSRCGCGLITT